LPSIATTLVSHTSKSGNGQKGPWALHIFKDAAGGSYQTFEAPIGNRAFGLLNQPVVLEYEEKPARDPQYPPNKVIQNIQPDTSVASPPTPATTDPSTGVVAPTGDDRQIQIMRQSALERAIRWVGAGNFEEGDVPLYKYAEEFLHYFQTGEYPGKSEKAILDEFADVFPA
jgi:hypothetical protein